MVASCAPVRVLTCAAAQRPNAAEPPARFISMTIAPRTTRKIRMPTFHSSVSEPIMPSTKTCSIVPVKLKFAYIRPPARMPMNRDE